MVETQTPRDCGKRVNNMGKQPLFGIGDPYVYSNLHCQFLTGNEMKVKTYFINILR